MKGAEGVQIVLGLSAGIAMLGIITFNAFTYSKQFKTFSKRWFMSLFAMIETEGW